MCNTLYGTLRTDERGIHVKVYHIRKKVGVDTYVHESVNIVLAELYIYEPLAFWFTLCI